jgi:hypothetical protein
MCPERATNCYQVEVRCKAQKKEYSYDQEAERHDIAHPILRPPYTRSALGWSFNGELGRLLSLHAI